MTQGIFNIDDNINSEIPYDLFNTRQAEQIRFGLEKGLDIKWYANPEFSAWQMAEIIDGLQKGLDVSVFAKPEMGVSVMRVIKKQLEEHGNGDIWYI